jgi:phosphatidylinositol alpha-mannosyltransferase
VTAVRRVALVCPYSWSRPGGVQSHVAGLARELRRRGLAVDVLAPLDAPVDGTTVVGLGRSIPIHDNGSVQRVALSPAAVARTWRYLRERGYDVVHLHEPMIPAACLTALLASRAPLVGTFHMVAATPRWYGTFGPICRQSLERLRVRIAVSEAARRYVARACPGEYEIVPNGLDLAGRPRRHAGRGTTIAFVGRPEPRKGLPILLDALALLPSTVRLLLIGPDRANVAAAARRTRLSADRLSIHGRVDDRERDRLLRTADVFCAPSLGRESFGVVLTEAMAAGLPVVATDIDGYRDVVDDRCALTVRPGDARSLAAALAAYLDDPGARTRAGTAGRARAERLAWPRIADRLLDAYTRAIA